MSVFLLSTSFALSIGTAPGVMDLGVLQPGKTYYFKFYLVSTFPSDVIVDLAPIDAHIDIYYRNVTDRYNFISSEASQRDISSWISFQQNPVLVSQSNAKLVYLPDGKVVRAHGEATVKLTIPKDADPCYYAEGINLAPRVASVGAGVGTSTIAVTRFLFVFKVAGDAERKGRIVNVLADSASPGARIDTLFKNEGTCTMLVRVNPLSVYDEYGSPLLNLSSGWVRVKPGDTAILSSYWHDAKPGTYETQVRADYITGYAYFSGTVEVPETITVAKKEVKKFPWWLILLLILLAVVYWWYRQ